jgi:hypothetical protein
MKKILLILLALAVVGGATGYYLWNKPHKDMAAAKIDLALDAKAIYDEYQADENAANAKYLEKVIAVKGTVKETTKDEDGTIKVSLETENDFGVLCVLSERANHARTDFPAGEAVTFKGNCTGLNFDVQLIDCVEVK